MAVLVWNHGTTRDKARQCLLHHLQQSGYADHVSWRGDAFAVSIGWGAVLDLVGQVLDDTVTIEKSRGAIGGVVLRQSEEALDELFPGGKQE